MKGYKLQLGSHLLVFPSPGQPHVGAALDLAEANQQLPLPKPEAGKQLSQALLALFINMCTDKRR